MLMKLSRAKSQVEKLQHYIKLVESYKVISIENWIIREYAITNSIAQVIKNADEQNRTSSSSPIDKLFVLSVINGKATDELHKWVKSGYKSKIKHNKKV